MQRFARVIRLRPEYRETYLRLHAAVWPAVEQTLRDANFRKDPQTQEWRKLTDPCQESVSEPGSGHWWTPLREVWHLSG